MGSRRFYVRMGYLLAVFHAVANPAFGPLTF